MKIFFAGSIRGGREDKELYAEIIAMLSSYGKVLTEHIGNKTLSALGEVEYTTQHIYDRDMKWLREADVVIAEVTTPSLGVGYEIAKAEQLGKRILCLHRVVEGKSISAMITGSPTLLVKTYKTLEDIKEQVEIFIHS